MVSIRRLDRHPHVLLVTGKEIQHDTYRDDLKRELLDRAGSPVRRGTHSFWITWFTPTNRGRGVRQRRPEQPTHPASHPWTASGGPTNGATDA